jgi:hypothetical protein
MTVRVGTAVLATALTAAAFGPPAASGGMIGRPAAAAAPAHRSCPLPTFGPGAAYRPELDRSGFTPDVTNALFPLVVGRTMIYTGVKDGSKALDVVVVTGHTRRVDGVLTRVVQDRLYLNTVLAERTSDYYAQDRCGNVWYFGEDTATLDAHGRVVDTGGTFHAGVDGAQPGVFMQVHPQLGRWFRQEWFAGEAEDTFRVIDVSAPVRVPFGSFRHALRTEERTALEPAVVDNKYYVRGVGAVFEGAVRGGDEQLRLVEIIS